MRVLSTGGAAVAALSLVMCADAWAGSTTWTFAGVVQSGLDAGQAVAGSVTFDLSALPVSNTNGLSHAAGGGFYFAPHTSPPHVSAVVTVGTKTVTVGGGSSILDVASVSVDKADFRYPAESYYDGYYIQVSSLSDGGANPYIGLGTFQYTDGVTPSSIFSNTNYSNPDLGLGQSVSWLTPGATSFGGLQSATGEYWSFALTSMSVSAVPEPGTLVLWVMGVAGLVARQRQGRGAVPSGT